MEHSNRRLLMISLFLGLIAAGFIYSYLANVKGMPIAPMTTLIVVAKQNIPERTVLNADMLGTKAVMNEMVTPSMITKTTNVLGAVSTERIFAGEPIRSERLSYKANPSTFTYAVPIGMRALTVSVNEVTGVAGMVLPGDYVDVIVTYSEQTSGSNTLDYTSTLAQNLLVLAIGNQFQTQPGQLNKDVKSVTLAVTPRQAEGIVLGDERAKLRLILRPATEHQVNSIGGPATPDDFKRRESATEQKPLGTPGTYKATPPTKVSTPSPKR